MRTCEQGCNGCDECTDYDDYADEDDGPPEFGCCMPPGECCMPGLHFPSECHTAAMYELAHGGAHIGAGPRTPKQEQG
jgi:hypothetical protein